MTATNHALTGALIGFVVGEPLIALPAAFLSHFVCDALPHFGPGKKSGDGWLKSKTFLKMLVIDALLCVVMVLVFAFKHPLHWELAAICAFLATSPDLFHINRFLHVKRGTAWRPNLYTRFAGKIQWFERPIGTVVEIVWFAVIGSLVLSFL